MTHDLSRAEMPGRAPHLAGTVNPFRYGEATCVPVVAGGLNLPRNRRPDTDCITRQGSVDSPSGL